MLNPTPSQPVATLPMSMIIWSVKRASTEAALPQIGGPFAPQSARNLIELVPGRDVLAHLGIVARERRTRLFSHSREERFVTRLAPWSRRRAV
jgi:hypothetical protein